MPGVPALVVTFTWVSLMSKCLLRTCVQEESLFFDHLSLGLDILHLNQSFEEHDFIHTEFFKTVTIL